MLTTSSCIVKLILWNIVNLSHLYFALCYILDNWGWNYKTQLTADAGIFIFILSSIQGLEWPWRKARLCKDVRSMVLPPPMAQLNVRLKLPTTKAARLWLECWVRDSSMTSLWEYIDAQFLAVFSFTKLWAKSPDDLILLRLTYSYLCTTKATRLWLECRVRDSSMTSIWEHN